MLPGAIILLALQAGAPFSSDSTTGEDCLSCHATADFGASRGHAPFEQGDCRACHLPAGGAAGHLEGLDPLQQARQLGRLLLTDPLPTRRRAVRVAAEELEREDFVWAREVGGEWRALRLQAAAADGAPAPEVAVRVERRSSVLGEVAVLELDGKAPFAVRTFADERSFGSAEGYFSARHSVRVLLGHEPAARLEVQIEGLDGQARSLQVAIADASGRSGEAPLRAEARTAPGGVVLLQISTAAPVRLEVRLPRRGALAAARLRDVAGAARHPALGSADYAGLQACLGCHEGFDHGKANHPLVPARRGGGYARPESLPLGADSRILCSTCHDPHGSRDRAFHARLDPQRELCIQCHADPR